MWETGVETHKPKWGSEEYSVKNENKHCREGHDFWQIARKSLRILRFFAAVFRLGHEQVLYRGCLPQWKQEKTGSQLLLFFREVWWSLEVESFIKRADKKNQETNRSKNLFVSF